MKPIISVILCFVIAFLAGSNAYALNCTQFNSFVGTTLITMFGTIFAINIGIIPVLYYELRKIEKEIGEDDILNYMKKEIRQNASVMTFLVISSIFLGVIKGFYSNTLADFLLSSLILGMLFLTILMVFDTVGGVIDLDFNQKNEKE